MKHEEGTFKDARGKNIYYQYWLPDNEVKAVIMLVHGIGEHSGRYMNVVNRFAANGYAIYGLDHEGHGKSEGGRESVEKMDHYAETHYTYFQMIRQWQKDKPVFLLGHSMGGLIGTLFLLDHQDELKGAIISGPPVKIPDNISGFTIFLVKFFSLLIPRLGLIGLEVEGISRDPKVLEAYLNDPLVYKGKTPARLAAEFLRNSKRVEMEAEKISLPMIILQGSEDKIVDPKGAQMLYDKISSTDKTLKIYTGFYHEVYNEPEKEQVLDDVQAWLDKHLL